MLKIKPFKCKHCKKEFVKRRPLQTVCGSSCAIEMEKERKAKKEANDWKAEKSEIKEKLLTHKDYIKILQTVFNTFIRLRDKNEPCISCGTNKDIKYDAGHFYPTTYQYLRFNEDNVHKQCSNNCNLHLSGNFQEYGPRLELKIGFDRLQKLHNDRHKRLELSIPEIKEKIKEYKEKIKKLK